MRESLKSLQAIPELGSGRTGVDFAIALCLASGISHLAGTAGAWAIARPGCDARKGGCAGKHDKRRHFMTFERGGAGVFVAICQVNVRFCRGNVGVCPGFVAFCRGPRPDLGEGEAGGSGHCPPGLVVGQTAVRRRVLSILD